MGYEKFVVFDRIHFDNSIGDKTFEGVYNRVSEVDRDFRYFLDLYCPDIVIMESPLPSGLMSPALSALATKLVTTTLDIYPGMFMMHPSYLRYVLGKSRYTRKDIGDLTSQIIEEEGFNTSTTRYSADEGVAFLLAYRMLIKLGYESKIESKIFTAEKERYLAKSEEFQESHLQRILT